MKGRPKVKQLEKTVTEWLIIFSVFLFPPAAIAEDITDLDQLLKLDGRKEPTIQERKEQPKQERREIQNRLERYSRDERKKEEIREGRAVRHHRKEVE